MKGKLIQKIVGVALGLTMAIGVGVAVETSRKDAVPVRAANLSISFGLNDTKVTKLSGSGYQSGTFSSGDVTFSVSNLMTTGQYRVNNATVSNNFNISNTTAVPGNITSITLATSSTGLASAFKVNWGTTSAPSAPSSSTGSSASAGTNILTWSASASSNYTFFHIAVVGKQSGTNTATTFTINYETGSSKTSTTTVVSAAGNKTTLDVTASPADTVQLSAVVTPASGTITSPSFTWSSEHENVATVNSTGLVTAVGKGTTRITASYEGDTTYAASTGYINITVANPNEVTFTAGTDVGTSSGQNPDSITKDGVTFACTSMHGRDNSAYRLYSGSTTTFSHASRKIASITFTEGSSSYPISGLSVASGSSGTYSNGVWTGPASSVSFTASAQVRVSKVVVELYNSTDPDVELDTYALTLTVGGSSSTVEVTTIENIDSNSESYSWERTSGDDCVTLANTSSDTVTIAPKGSLFAQCVITLTVEGEHNGVAITPVTKTVTVTVARASTEANPYSIVEAKKVIDFNDDTYRTQAYVTGKISRVEEYISTYNSITYDISDDGTTDNELQAYSGKGLESANFSSISDLTVGDAVVVRGTLQYASSTYRFTYNNYLISRTADSVTLSISGQTTSFTQGECFSLGNAVITATYAVSGPQTIANNSELLSFTIEGDELTTSTVLNVDDHNTGEVQITYEDANGKTASLTYPISVSYASVSSVTLNHHNLTIDPVSETNFSVTLNSNVDPNSEAEWEVTNKTGSSLDLQNYGIMSTGNLTATLTAVGGSTDSGTLIVTATVGGVSDTCEVTVTGDAYVVFDKDSVQGIVGATLNNTVKVTPVGLSTPTGYKWSVTEGSSVVAATTGSATTTLTFLAAGSATLHVEVTDGTDTAEGNISVSVIKSLNTIKGAGTITNYNESYIVADQNYSNGDAVSSYNGTNFDVAFSKGNGSNDPKYYTGNPVGVRVYGSGIITVSSTKTLTKIEITATNNTKTISANVGSVEGYTWTGSASEVAFTVASGSGNLPVSTIKVYWSETTEGTTISNTNYNAQKAVLEFVDDFASKMTAVCDAVHGNTNPSSLNTAWSNAYNTFTSKRNGLNSSDQELFDALIVNATASKSGDDLQKALASYNYIYAKYHESLSSGDFLHSTSGRGAVQASAYVSPLTVINSENALSAILIVAITSISTLGGYFFLRRRKEQ